MRKHLVSLVLALCALSAPQHISALATKKTLSDADAATILKSIETLKLDKMYTFNPEKKKFKKGALKNVKLPGTATERSAALKAFKNAVNSFETAQNAAEKARREVIESQGTAQEKSASQELKEARAHASDAQLALRKNAIIELIMNLSITLGKELTLAKEHSELKNGQTAVKEIKAATDMLQKYLNELLY